jgi:hypothetical protein
MARAADVLVFPSPTKPWGAAPPADGPPWRSDVARLPRAVPLFGEVSLDALPTSSDADDRQHVAHLYGVDNESRWFFREDGLVFLGRRDGGAFSSQDNRLVIPGFAPGTVYRCAVAFTRDDFVIAVEGQLTTLFAHTLGIADATELRIGRDGTSRFLDGHLRHLAYFPRRLNDDALRRVTM